MDGGNNWAPLLTFPSTSGVSALALDSEAPSTLYAGTVALEIVRSKDGGASWEPVNTGLTTVRGARTVKVLAISPTGTCLHAGFGNDGVFALATHPDPSCPLSFPVAAAVLPTSRSVQVQRHSDRVRHAHQSIGRDE